VSLLAQAAADARRILNDSARGFATAITLTNPDGTAASLKGFQTDVGLTIEPETGVPVAGRRASVALSLADIVDAGIGMPRNVPDTNSSPWLVTWTPPTGSAQTMKVIDVLPDKLGIVVLLLERWQE
jgi:hypothetical protein